MLSWLYLFSFLLFSIFTVSCHRENEKQSDQMRHSDMKEAESKTVPIVIEVENAQHPQQKTLPSADEVSPPITSIPSFPVLAPMPILPGPSIINRESVDDDERREKINEDCCCDNSCDLGRATFFAPNGPPDWFSVQVPPLPDTVVISKNRKAQSAKGGISFTSNGIKIKSPGDYWISFSAVVLNENQDPRITPLFLAQNGNINLSDPSSELIALGYLPTGVLTTIQGSGPLMDIAKGTELSLLLSSGGTSEPTPISIVFWEISLYKICGRNSST